uniref:Uncharacterized protein n=1 Tax=Clastoptera arizonana TaxID=38151 RepID=A0A1B6DZI6_9HEMI
MFLKCTLFLCLALSTVSGFDYQAVTKCSDIQGDPDFTFSQPRDVIGIIATSSKDDIDIDRCVIYIRGSYYITSFKKDWSYRVVQFKQFKKLSNAAFSQVGPDGNTYRVTVLKSYGPECGNMTLRYRCSDTVGKEGITPQVFVHGNVFDGLCGKCIKDAAAYASQVLQQTVTLYPFKNQCDTAHLT